MLPVLKEAGVVDSGGQGLLEVLKRCLSTASLAKKLIILTLRALQVPAVTKISAQAEAEIKFGYCTEFIILLDKPLPMRRRT